MRLLYVIHRPDRRADALTTLTREVRDYAGQLVVRATRLERHLEAALADSNPPAALVYALNPVENATMRALVAPADAMERARLHYDAAVRDAGVTCQHTRCGLRAAYTWSIVSATGILSCRAHLPRPEDSDGPDATRPCVWDVADAENPVVRCGQPSNVLADDEPLCSLHYVAWLDRTDAVVSTAGLA